MSRGLPGRWGASHRVRHGPACRSGSPGDPFPGLLKVVCSESACILVSRLIFFLGLPEFSSELNDFLKLNFTLTSNKDPEINSKFGLSIFILDNRLLVSAFILLETKSTSPLYILSL